MGRLGRAAIFLREANVCVLPRGILWNRRAVRYGHWVVAAAARHVYREEVGVAAFVRCLQLQLTRVKYMPRASTERVAVMAGVGHVVQTVMLCAGMTR